MTELDEATFEEAVIESGTASLIQFHAPWSGPCRQLEGVLKKLSVENEGQILVGRIDIETEFGLTEKYGIRGVPTLMIFQGGELIGTHVGAAPKVVIDEWLSDQLKL